VPGSDGPRVRARLESVGARLRVEGDTDGFALILPAGGDALLSHLAVAPHAQRRGLGRRLVEDALEQARDMGAGALLLEVRTSSTAALALYADLGFAAVREPAPHPLGGAPMLLLRREVG
jgi:ribosomal protein S18 acetylase RimI-like enzyme